MKIKLIKAKFNGTYAYKYLPFEYCCSAIQENKTIILTDKDFAYDDSWEEEIYPKPQFCTTLTEERSCYEDTWDETTNYPINYCPHCGEKIEIEVSDEIDLSLEFSHLESARKSLSSEANETDSKRKDAELTEKVRKLDQKINWFYSLAEWNGEYTNEEKI